MRYIYYHGKFRPQGIRNLETLLSAAHNAKLTEVTVMLCSEGGDVNSGIGLYNFIRLLPMTVHMHAMGICSSIAATAFLAGKNRTAVPNSVFTLHAPIYVEGPNLGAISPNTNLISGPFRSVLGWKDDMIQRRFDTKDYRILTEDAVKQGIISEIKEVKIEPSDEIVVVDIPDG